MTTNLRTPDRRPAVGVCDGPNDAEPAHTRLTGARVRPEQVAVLARDQGDTARMRPDQDQGAGGA